MAGRVGLAANKAVQARRLAVIRSLWFTECTLDAIGERLGLAGKTISALARRAGLPPRRGYTAAMPTPNLASPKPEPRQSPRKVARTPEQISKTVTGKLKSPPGQPDKAEITLRLVLPRTVLERLSVRAVRETRKLEAVVTEILEREGTG